MRLLIDTSGVQFTVGQAPQPRNDYKDKNRQATTPDGRSIWVVKLGAQDERNLEVLWVEVAGEQPKVTTGQPVQIRGLVYAPWVGRDNKIRRSFRADGIEPVNGSKTAPHAV